MKTFNNLQELWDYCAFCPVCQESCRKVQPQIGPTNYSVQSIEKLGNILEIKTSIRFRGGKFAVDFNIDCMSNTVQSTITAHPDDGDEPPQGANRAFTFLRLSSDCEKCGCTHSNSGEMEIPFNGTISSVSLDREGLYLLELDDKFHLTLIYDRRAMLVSRCYMEPGSMAIDDNKVLELPLVRFDFTNMDKVVNKIKTLILFS